MTKRDKRPAAVLTAEDLDRVAPPDVQLRGELAARVLLATAEELRRVQRALRVRAVAQG